MKTFGTYIGLQLVCFQCFPNAEGIYTKHAACIGLPQPIDAAFFGLQEEEFVKIFALKRVSCKFHEILQMFYLHTALLLGIGKMKRGDLSINLRANPQISHADCIIFSNC